MPRTDWSKSLDRLNGVLAAVAAGTSLAQVGRDFEMSPAVVYGLKRQYLSTYKKHGRLSPTVLAAGRRHANWLPAEDTAIRQLWPTPRTHAQLFALLPARTRRAIVSRASALGVRLERSQRPPLPRIKAIETSWSEDEERTLRRMHGNGATATEIALVLVPRTIYAVRQAIFRLGLVCSAETISSRRSDTARKRFGMDGVRLDKIETPDMTLEQARETLPLNGAWVTFFTSKRKVSSGDRLRISAARALVEAGLAKTRTGRSDAGALRYMIRATEGLGHG